MISFCAEFGSSLGRPQCLNMGGIRVVIAGDAAVVINKIQPPAVRLFTDGHVSRRTMRFHLLGRSQGGNGDSTVDNQVGSHFQKIQDCYFYLA